MSNYEYLQLSYQRDLKRVKLPKFQRGLVWTKQKRNDLILTLHRDFPFGALLVAPIEGEQSQLRLLDGQQRLSTIKNYEDNKAAYWAQLNPENYNRSLQAINQLIPDKDMQVDQHLFKQLLDPQYELANWTDDFDSMDKDTKKDLRSIVQKTRNSIADYIDLDSLLIPVIKFLGNESDLPEVFENLNRGGTPLSKYEIFNAAWVDSRLTLPTESNLADEVLSNVKNYYVKMNETSDFEVDDFSEDDLTESREINLAEFGRSLGQFTVKRIPALITNNGANAKIVNEIGFGLLAILVNVDNKKIASVHTYTGEIQQNLSHMLLRIDELSKKLNDVFSKILKQNISFNTKQNAKKALYSTGLSTTFKVLSYFASLWEAPSEKLNIILANLPSYYVFDYLNGTWTAHGDQRLQDYYPKINNKSYLEPLSKEKLQTAFKRWIEDNPGTRQSFTKETKALITIHSNLTYLSAKIPTGEDFEFEHIIPKARILKFDPKITSVHTSSLGNGMLLPKSDNNKKKDKTLYEIDNSSQYSELINESLYPYEKNLSHVLNNLENNQFSEVNAFISNRAQQVSDVIIAGLLNS